MEKLGFSDIEYPSMREELIHYLLGLSDPVYQNECWINGKCGDGAHGEFDYAVHFLFDDTRSASDPNSLIGIFLKNEEEVYLIRDLCKKIDNIFKKYGTNMSDKEYINCPEWTGVLASAKKAYDFISKN